MTRQATDQLYIELDYFTPEEYYVYVAEAQGAITSQSTISCDAVKIVESLAEFTSQFTQTATISHIHGSDLFAFSEAAIAALVDRIRDINLESAAAFDIATDYGLIKQGASTEAADFALAITAELSRGFDIDMSAAFSLVSDASVTLPLAADLVAESNINIQAEITTDASAAVTSEFTQTADVAKTVDAVSSLEEEFQTEVTAERIRGLDSAAEITTDLTVIISHIHGADLVIDGFATVTADVTVDYSGAAALESVSTVTAASEVNYSASAAMSVISSVFSSRWLGTYRPRTVVSTNTVFDNSIFKYGTHSVRSGRWNTRVPATGTIRRDSDLVIKDNDQFVIEWWAYRTHEIIAAFDETAMIAFGGIPLSGNNENNFGNLTNNAAHWAFGTGYAFPAGFRWRFRYNTSSGPIDIQSSTLGSLTQAGWPVNTWTHFAIRRGSDGVIRVLVGGIEYITSTYSGRIFGLNPNYISMVSMDGTTPSTQYTAYDELSFRIGNSTISGLTQPIKGDYPSQRLLLHFDGDFNDDLSVNEIADAALSSSTELTAKLSGPVPAEAALSSEFAFVAAAGKNQELILLAFTESQLSISFDIVKNVAAELTSTAEIITDATRIQEAASAIDSTVTVTSDVSVVTDITALFNNTFVLDTAAEIIRDNSALLTLESQQDCSVERILSSDAELINTSELTSDVFKVVIVDALFDSTTELVITGDRVRFGQSELTNEFSQDCQAVAIFAGDSIQLSEFTIDAQASRLGEIELVASGFAQLASDVTRIRESTAEMAAESQITVVTSNVIGFDIEPISAAASLDGILDRIRFVDCSLPSESLLDCSVLITRDFSSNLTTDSTVTIEVSRILTTDSSSNAVSDLNGSLSVIHSFTIAAESTALMQTEGTAGIFAQSECSSEFSMSVLGQKTTEIILTAFGNSTVTTDIERLRDFEITALCQAAVEATVVKIHEFQIASNSISQLAAIAGVQVNAAAALQSNGFVLSTGREIRLDEIVYVIPAETRIYKIASESRIRKVTGESRIYTIRSL